MNSILIANGGVQVAPPPTVAFIYLKKILEFVGGEGGGEGPRHASTLFNFTILFGQAVEK
jgi:hypothetical protein